MPAPVAGRPAGGARLGLLTLVLASLGGMAVGYIATPFHYLDAITLVAAVIGPPVLIAAGLAMRHATPLRWLTSGGRITRPTALCGLAAFVVLAPGNTILGLNELLDPSAAVAVTLPVRAAWISTGRHNYDFMASVVPDKASPLGRWSFSGPQPVRLLAADWSRIVPGRSALVLREHPGRFGFAWYERFPAVAP